MIKELLNLAIAKHQYLSVSLSSITWPSLWLQKITALLTTDKKQYFAPPHPIIFNILLAVLVILFLRLEKTLNMSLCTLISPLLTYVCSKSGKGWSSKIGSTDTSQSSSDRVSSIANPPAENGLPVKLLLVWSNSWLLECPGSCSLCFPESDIPVTSTQLECNSPARFARMGVENKGAASRINQQICL